MLLLLDAFRNDNFAVVINAAAFIEHNSALRSAESAVVPIDLVMAQREMRTLRRCVNLHHDAILVSAFAQRDRTGLWQRVSFCITMINTTMAGHDGKHRVGLSIRRINELAFKDTDNQKGGQAGGQDDVSLLRWAGHYLDSMIREGIAEASVTSWNSKNALVSDIVSNFDLDTTVSLLEGEKGSASTSAPADPQSYPLLLAGVLRSQSSACL